MLFSSLTRFPAATQVSVPAACLQCLRYAPLFPWTELRMSLSTRCGRPSCVRVVCSPGCGHRRRRGRWAGGGASHRWWRGATDGSQATGCGAGACHCDALEHVWSTVPRDSPRGVRVRRLQGTSGGATSNLGALPGKPVSHWQRRKERSRRDKRVNPMTSVQVRAGPAFAVRCSSAWVDAVPLFIFLHSTLACTCTMPLSKRCGRKWP